MIRYFKVLTELLIAVASAALFFLGMIVAVDVIFRNAGLFYVPGVSDYMTFAQIVLTCCAIPAAFVTGKHLVVEIGTYKLADRNKARLEAVWLLLAAPVLGLLSKLVFQEGLHLASRGRTMGVHGWSPNLYHMPVAAALFVCAVLCLVVGLAKASGRLRFLQANT